MYHNNIDYILAWLKIKSLQSKYIIYILVDICSLLGYKTANASRCEIGNRSMAISTSESAAIGSEVVP